MKTPLLLLAVLMAGLRPGLALVVENTPVDNQEFVTRLYPSGSLDTPPCTRGGIEPGDIERAPDCASKIGDDYLQKKSQGYVVSESFTHGTAAQRMRWLKKGMTTGDHRQGNTFSLRDSQL